jgi:large subunit ribosomal protein L29
MRAAEMREQTVEELMAKEKELAGQLFALRLQKVTGQLDNPAKIGQAKRDLARVLTVLREKA